MKHQSVKFDLKGVAEFLNHLEDAILVSLLAAMLVLASVQILARNFFQAGIIWGDILVRVMVLWVGLVGAMVAARRNQHISIDIVSRLLPQGVKKAVNAVLNLFAAVVCGIVAYYSLRLVRLEYLDGVVAFGAVPTWTLESIIPLSFGVMALRYFVLMLTEVKQWQS
jgi:TRAP-type C4-dicarboxylate transport system permease small subunit